MFKSVLALSLMGALLGVLAFSAESPLVGFLRKQADERKVFYGDQSQEKIELKKKHEAKRTNLLLEHRKQRAQFIEEKHSADERKTFFKKQREEMAELKQGQKAEKLELEKSLKLKLKEFREKQKSELADFKKNS